MKRIISLIAIVLVIFIIKNISQTDSPSGNTPGNAECLSLMRQEIESQGAISPQARENLAQCEQKTSVASGNECLQLEKQMQEMDQTGQYNPEVMDKLGECNRKRADRLGSGKPGAPLLGNTFTYPKNALAHYKWLGNIEYFTVYDNRIQLKDTTVSEAKTVIRFSDVNNLKNGGSLLNGIVITYKGKNNKEDRFSISLRSNADIGLSEEQTAQGKLYQLLEKQWEKHK